MTKKDFGETVTEIPGIGPVSCKNVAPGLSLQELLKAYEGASKTYTPEDLLSADPTRWPVVRGIMGVVDRINKAYEDEADRSRD